MSELLQLQAWFAAQCHDDWEHQHGIHIQTLDNPGWLVEIDLAGTALQDRAFRTLTYGVDAQHHPQSQRWFDCAVHATTWRGAGDVTQLARLLALFLDWANQNEIPPIRK